MRYYWIINKFSRYSARDDRTTRLIKNLWGTECERVSKKSCGISSYLCDPDSIFQSLEDFVGVPESDLGLISDLGHLDQPGVGGLVFVTEFQDLGLESLHEAGLALLGGKRLF